MIPSISDEVGWEAEERDALREGSILLRLVAGEYVGGGNVGIKFIFNGGSFAGVSRGPRRDVDKEDKEASCGGEVGKLGWEVPEFNLSDRDFKSKELGEICPLLEMDSDCESAVLESDREPWACESAPMSENLSQIQENQTNGLWQSTVQKGIQALLGPPASASKRFPVTLKIFYPLEETGLEFFRLRAGPHSELRKSCYSRGFPSSP